MIKSKLFVIVFVLVCFFVVNINSTLWVPGSNGLDCKIYGNNGSSIDLTPLLNSDEYRGVYLYIDGILEFGFCGNGFRTDCNNELGLSCLYMGHSRVPYGIENENSQYNFIDNGVQLIYTPYKEYYGCKRTLQLNLQCDSNPFYIYTYGAQDVTCNININILSKYACKSCLNDCSGRGVCDERSGICNCNDQSTGDGCLESTLSISSVTNTTVLGGDILIFGYFGTTSNSIQVKIGDLNCINILATKSEITCSVPSLNNFKNGLSKDVVVIDNGVNATLVNGFTYQNLTCSPSCNADHSYCNGYSGICECDDQSSGDTCFISKLKISKVTPSTILGGDSIINGYFGTTTSIKVFLNNESCTIKTISINSITFIAPPGNGSKNISIEDKGFNDTLVNGFIYQDLKCTPSCHSIHGKCNIYKGICECDTQSNGDQCQLSRLYVDSTSISTSNNKNIVMVYGYFGQITSQFNISIGNQSCKNIIQYNYTTISCEIGNGNGTYNVTIQDNDLIFIGVNLFKYPTQNDLNNNNNNKNNNKKIIAVSIVVPVVGASLIIISSVIIYKKYYHGKSKSIKDKKNIKLGSSLSNIS